jgi:type VI secretion system secreted protein Hcp
MYSKSDSFSVRDKLWQTAWLLLAVVAGAHTSGRLAAAAYLKIDDIPGESTRAGYEDWIEISELHTDLRRTLDTGRLSGSADVGPVVIGKEIDKATPYLAQALFRGTRLGEVEIELTRATRDGGNTLYAQFLLHDASVAKFSQESSEGSEVIEEVAFNYTEIEWHYRELEVDSGSTLDEVGTYFDVVAAVGGVLEEVDNRPSIPPTGTLKVNLGDTLYTVIRILDPDTPPENLIVTATSLDPDLAVVEYFEYEGNGWTIGVSANTRLRGGTSIAISASDGEHSTSRYLPVLVGGDETAYEAFLTASFGNLLEKYPDLALPLEDPDEDDLSTIVEYYLGTHPNIATPMHEAMEVIPQRTPNGDQILVRYYRRNDEEGLSGTLNASQDLSQWFPLGAKSQPPLSETSTTSKTHPLYDQVEAVISLGPQPPPTFLLRYILTGDF